MTPPTGTGAGTRPSGSGLVAVVRHHPVGSFVTLTFALSWAYWVPLALTGGEGSHVPGLLGPGLAAMVVSAIAQGRAGPRDLAARSVRWRVPPRWYVVALAPLLAGAVGLLVVAVADPSSLRLGGLDRFPGLPEVGWVGVFLLVLLLNGFGEEVGWRGFLWPRLRRDRSLAGAAGLLTLPWALWHLPTFWLATGMDLDPLVLPGWLIGLAAGAVVLGWLYEHTGSLLLVALFHTSLNMVSATDIGGLPAALASAGVIAAAILRLRRDASTRAAARRVAR